MAKDTKSKTVREKAKKAIREKPKKKEKKNRATVSTLIGGLILFAEALIIIGIALLVWL